FVQPGILVREVFDDGDRDRLVETVSGGLSTVEEPVLSNAIQYWKNIDQTVGERIEKAIGTAAADEMSGGDPLNS
ncbi:MAG: catalase-related domain-containing protein, partial [Brachybacterium tyrofermentans]